MVETQNSCDQSIPDEIPTEENTVTMDEQNEQPGRTIEQTPYEAVVTSLIRDTD